MTVLTVNINDKKDKKALKALKAVMDAFDISYGIRSQKEADSISIPIEEWEEIQKRLNTERLYDDFATSVQAIKDDINGISTLKNARELLHGY